MPKRILRGKVVSRTDKTVVVKVEKTITEKKYGKIIRSHKKYKAHDPRNECKINDDICIVESRPFSKTKFFEIISQDKN